MVHNPRNIELYNNTRQARKTGLSYGVIAKKFNTSKSNVSLWCRDIKLSENQRNKLVGNSRWILTLGAKFNHDRRNKEIKLIMEKAQQEIKRMDYDSFFIAGIILYWAEGHKRKTLSVTNSDEKVILLMLRWFEIVFKINIQKDIKAYLHIHKGNDDIKIKKYWSRITKIPLKNFGKSFIKPQGTGHRKNILPHGIIRIRVAGKGSEDKRHQIMGWIEKVFQLSLKIK